MSRKRLRSEQEQDVSASSGERATDETADAAYTENRVSHVRDGKPRRARIGGRKRHRTGVAPPREVNHGWSHGRVARAPLPPEIYNRPMAIEFVAQRLQIGDVILTSLPDQEREVDATVVREIDRTETAVRATLRVEGREDFVKEWPLGELVTVVRGP
jgi:hypothetical protein